MTKIYTKTGDKGITFDGFVRISKSSARIDLLGTIDELNCVLGIAKTYAGTVDRRLIENTQNVLYELMANISTDKLFAFDICVETMESMIDEWSKELPELKEFIVPAGNLQLARAVCRRAERKAVIWKSGKVDEHKDNVIRFLNRLSDWLFVLARKTEQLV